MRCKREDKLNEVKEFVDDYCEIHGYGPSTREVASKCGLSNGMAVYYLKELVACGRIGKGRSYMSVKPSNPTTDSVMVPVLGAVPCGPLEDVEEYAEDHLAMPAFFTGKNECYFLRANGDSMIDAGIDDGDLVLVKKCSTTDKGRIVVALVDNRVTLKRLMHDGKRFYLQPENDRYENIYPDKLEIQGVALRVIKSL